MPSPPCSALQAVEALGPLLDAWVVPELAATAAALLGKGQPANLQAVHCLLPHVRMLVPEADNNSFSVSEQQSCFRQFEAYIQALIIVTCACGH